MTAPDDTPSQTPGWYPAPDDSNSEIYWNGTRFHGSRKKESAPPDTRRQRFKRGLGTAFSWQGWKAIAAIAATAVAIGTVSITYGTFKLSKQTLDANTTQQASDRFGKGIEHLGKTDSIDVRLGGIYELDKLARDTPSEHADVYNVLTSFVRGHAVSGNGVCVVANTPGLIAPTAGYQRPSEDIQTVLNLLGQRDRAESTDQVVNISHSCLMGAYFPDYDHANYANVNMNGADLRGANLGKAGLENVSLLGATIDDAFIVDANLRSAKLEYAHMWRANLMQADLQEAHLAHADLSGAYLCKADLSGADLSNANLTNIVYDTDTRWSSGFQPPASRPGPCPTTP